MCLSQSVLWNTVDLQSTNFDDILKPKYNSLDKEMVNENVICKMVAIFS